MSRREVIALGREKVHLNLARIKKGGYIFEVCVNPDEASKFLEGHQVPVKDVIFAEKIFHHSQSGEVASETRMEEAFGTSDPLKVAEIILNEGEIQFSQEYRKKLHEQKMNRILEILHRNGVDPRTKAPHPLQRLKNAFEEARITPDDKKTAEAQIQHVLKKLQPVLPISFEQKTFEILLPGQHAGKTSQFIHQFGSVKSEQWNTGGSWTGIVEIPGGLEEEFLNKLNSLSKGTVSMKKLR